MLPDSNRRTLAPRPIGDSTATESSIAESSRQVGVTDSADDIDDMLSLLVQATGEILLLNMTKESVQQIVGPGAVWPELPETREEIAESIILDTKAGASGRPNQAADLQKLQTAMPFVLQIPGMNPVPIGERYLELLDVDIEARRGRGLAVDRGDEPDDGSAANPRWRRPQRARERAEPAGWPGRQQCATSTRDRARATAGISCAGNSSLISKL